jgi:hypothetical protein
MNVATPQLKHIFFVATRDTQNVYFRAAHLRITLRLRNKRSAFETDANTVATE